MCKKLPLLITAPLEFLPGLKSRVEAENTLHYSYGCSEYDLRNILANTPFRAWMVSPCPTYFIGKDLLELCPSLEFIATPSTGSNHVDVGWLREHNIGFYCLKETNEVNTIFASSEFTFNLLISVIRKTPYAFQSVKKGTWRINEKEFRGRELHGLHLGIIGFGRIGSNLARYANAFGMHIQAFDPYVSTYPEYVFPQNSLQKMVSSVDALVVCVHLNNQTFHLINTELFSHMKAGIYFINTSRGDVVDEKALLENLQSGKIEAAGLDVISGEQNPDLSSHPLVKYADTHHNLIITPHIAGLTYDSERKAQEAAYNAILKHFSKD